MNATDNYYFAYGSNMLSARLRERIASAEVLGAAQLDGYAWCCNKLGRDGTAKANLVRRAGDAVHGVLYRIDADAWQQLDRFEPNYCRISVEVTHAGQIRTAGTYISELLTDRPAKPSYLQCIISGATENDLPPAYIEQIEAVCR